ncbi:hypothetical protein SNE40_017278 [Patella caerulea]|uniref:Uncharacterized protein n=1 Tax=Patella caerulea TaxID=87958 RepID=A0AAN8JDJ9_PATCE
MADSKKTATTRSSTSFDLASVLFDNKDTGRKPPKTIEGSSKIGSMAIDAEFASSSMSVPSCKKGDEIISSQIDKIARLSASKSQSFEDFKTEMNDTHRKTFEELQLLIANSFAS